MKRGLRTALVSALALLLVALVGLVATVRLRWDRTFEAPVPAIHASTDPAVIARGRYLVYGPAHCPDCHVAAYRQDMVKRGEQVPLAGGFSFASRFGTFWTPNLTPDSETGIGRLSDGQLARVLRHGVRPDGRAALPFMRFQNLSDEDLIALVSFLRSQPAVRNAVPDHELNFGGKAILAFLIKPVGPNGDPPRRSPASAPTVERGAYLANSVAGCAECHTRLSPMDGSDVGPRLAGGDPMTAKDNPGYVVVPPNLTPDPATGHITAWTEDQFVARFRSGALIQGTVMPWAEFGRMTEADVRAIYRYLRSVPPVKNETGPSLRKRS